MVNPLIPDTVAEWNENAPFRHRQIVSGKDLSYEKILLPTIYRLIGDISDKAIVDIGCGEGDLAARLSGKAKKVVGVDPAEKMIEIAQREHGYLKNIEFISRSIEDYAESAPMASYDVAIANMSLMVIPNLDRAVEATKYILKGEATFAVTITHPFFWTFYKHLEDAKEFDYLKEHIQRTPFVISLYDEPLPSETTIFHRPLGTYTEVFTRHGFRIEQILEPIPAPEVERLYPDPWQFPRFLAFRCVSCEK